MVAGKSSGEAWWKIDGGRTVTVRGRRMACGLDVSRGGGGGVVEFFGQAYTR